MFSTETRKTKKDVPSPADDRIAEAARSLKVRTALPAQREKILAAFQEPSSSTAVRPASRLPRRLAIGAMTAAVGSVVALLSGPHFATPPVSAASIVDAIQSTNTWHLSGWRLIKGKRVAWEVWGRRSPFFYREQIGDEIVVDDGNTRQHFLPPQRLHRRGVLFIMPTRPLHPQQTEEQPQNAAYDTTAFLGGTSGDYARGFTLVAQGKGALTLQGDDVHFGDIGEQVRITADRTTRLPQNYALIRSRYKGEDHLGHPIKTSSWTKALLRAEYNVPVPLDILQSTGEVASSASSYQTIDLTATPDTPTGFQYGVARKGGITVACETLNRDEEGNLRLKYQVWLGDVKTGTEDSQLYPSLMLRCPPYTQPREGEYPMDNNGVAYLNLNAPDADTGGRAKDYRFEYLAIVDPRKNGTPVKPGTLTLPVRVQVAIFEDDDENNMRLRSVADETLTMTVPLPTRISSLEYDRPRPQMPGLSWSLADQQQSLRLITSWQRGVYWSNRGEGRTTSPPGVINRSYLERAKHEYTITLAEAERAKDKKMIENMRLGIKLVEERLQGKR